MKHWILKNRIPTQIEDIEEWSRAFEDSESRRVAINPIGKGVEVSTVFLGLDYNFSGVGPPLLFETMIFGGARNREQWRHSTWDEASLFHVQLVAEMTKVIIKEQADIREYIKKNPVRMIRL